MSPRLLAAALLLLPACSSQDPGAPEPPAPRRPDQGEVVALEIVPTVLRAGRDHPVTIRAFVIGGADDVRFSFQNLQEDIALARTGQTVFPAEGGARPVAIWEATVSSADLLRQPTLRGKNVQVGGVLLTDGSIATVFAWLDDVVRQVLIVRLGDDAQGTSRVVNLRVDQHEVAFMGNPARGPVPALQAMSPLLRRFYQLFSDDFPFLTVIGTRRLPGNAAGLHLGYRNTTLGIGQELFDRRAQVDLGSANRLESVIVYPDFSTADLASSTFSHEIAHRWMVRLTGRGFGQSGSHWPVSDMAHGIMGFGVPSTSGRLRFGIDAAGPGRYRFVGRPQAQRFNALELYLMGLLPASEVTDTFRLFVFPSSDQIPVPREGVEFAALEEPFTIDSVIARTGSRQPDASEAPRQFRVGAIVMSFGRLLSPEEMAFYDMLVERGEAREPLPSIATDLDEGVPLVLPFYLATGGRAELVLRLFPPLSSTQTGTEP